MEFKELNEKKKTTKIKPANLWELFGRFLYVVGPTYTAHSQRTAYIALMLDRAVLSHPLATRKLVFSAYFHDIGSIGKDEEYLNNENYDVEHAIDGYLILKYNSPLKNHAKIVLYHHSRWDTSYIDPYYVLGNRLSLCDTFDELYENGHDMNYILKYLNDNKGKLFNPSDVNALNKLAKRIDLKYVLDSGQYLDVLTKYIKGLHFTSNLTNGYINMLSSLFERYDAVTLDHSKTVALCAYYLGQAMKLDIDQCYNLYFAGLIHDLGKIYIPESILKKPGKLTKEEYEVMKTHVSKTHDLIHGILPENIVQIAVRHHEKLDGSGYPNHINGIHLTLEQRILAVADVISALISKRSYKEGFDYEKTKNVLLDEASKNHLDERVISAFIENHDFIISEFKKVFDESLENEKMMKEEKRDLIKKLENPRKGLNLPIRAK